MMRAGYFCLTLLMTVLMMTVFVACGDGNKPTDTDTATTATTSTPTTALPSVGWIDADSLRVRGGAGLSFEVIGGITGGERVQITGKTGDWYAIRFGDTTGYVSAQYISFTDPATVTTADTADTTALPEEVTATTAP